MTQVDGEVAELTAMVRGLRARRAVDRVSELRALAALASKLPQSAIARTLRVSQPAVSKRLREAVEVPAVREGFSGGSPFEVAQRYAAGLLSRAQVLEELARWPYVSAVAGDGEDWLSGDPGEFEQVGRALDDGLIEDELYDELVARRAGDETPG